MRKKAIEYKLDVDCRNIKKRIYMLVEALSFQNLYCTFSKHFFIYKIENTFNIILKIISHLILTQKKYEKYFILLAVNKKHCKC